MSESFQSDRSDVPSPRECFERAERHVSCIRKLLVKSQRRLRGAGHRGAMHDAIRIIDSIERLSSYGRRCDAANAVEIADHIEILISLLQREFDDILACLKSSRG